jgi:hypothetical protein
MSITQAPPETDSIGNDTGRRPRARRWPGKRLGMAGVASGISEGEHRPSFKASGTSTGTWLRSTDERDRMAAGEVVRDRNPPGRRVPKSG